MKPFIPKEIPDLPDCYGITVYFSNGKKEDFEIVSHNLDFEKGILWYTTFEDKMGWLNSSYVMRVECDHRFSQIKELQKKESERKASEHAA